MTVGIYSLYWEDQDLIYIGQSQDINKRFREHLNLLSKNKHTNYKVQNAYNNFGIPNLNILEECYINQLNDLEIIWQKEFDSLNSLDLIEAGQVGYGINSNSAKYTKIQILLVFRALYSTVDTYYTISNKYNVNKSLIGDINSGNSHLWLKTKYPKLYNRLTNRLSNSLSISNCYKKLPIVKSPLGILYIVKNIREFALEHNLQNSHLGEVIRGNRKSHKGYTLNTPPEF
jgi:hypothetical protein